MASISTWFRYLFHKLDYSLILSIKSYRKEQFSDREYLNMIFKNLFQGRLTYLHWDKGLEMAPTMASNGNTLLVRKLPIPDSRYVFIGDAVVLKDPNNSDKFLIRRLAAIPGCEMVSIDEKDKPFVLEKDQCWVVAENKELKPKEAYDSRTFGPISMGDIVGRAIYCLRNAVDHGPVNNSGSAKYADSSVLSIELDVDEMAKNHQA